MLLTIDAGNTNIVIVVFEGGKVVFESRVDTNKACMADQYAVLLSDIMHLYGFDKSAIDGAIIASVVPPVTKQLTLAVKRLTGIEPLIVEPGLKTGLNIKIDDPLSVGADLVCGAAAAKSLYTPPCIVIDLGTVTKILMIDKEGALRGGVLAAGVGVSFEVMASKTALLPLVDAGGTKKVIGSNTVDCIRSGILYGTACMLDGLIARFEREIGEKCEVVATGGFAEAITPYCEREIIVNCALVSEGLRLIYEKNRNS